MNNRYVKPGIGFTLGALLGVIAVIEAPSDKKDPDNYIAYCVVVLAFALLGGIVGNMFNGKVDVNSPAEIRKRNNKTLKRLKEVVEGEPVSLLTPQEYDEFANIIQNKSPAEIIRINIARANYEAAINDISPLGIAVKDIPTPITLVQKSHPHTAVTYSYESLKTSLENDGYAMLMDTDTDLEINRDNFIIRKNYAPEIMDFIKEVRAVLNHRASIAALPLVYSGNNSLVIFAEQQRRMPLISRYAQLAHDPETGGLTTVSVNRLNS